MELPGDWTVNDPASVDELERAEGAVELRLPEDLRAFYLAGDGGEAWFGDPDRDESFFFLQIYSLADVIGVAEAMAEFSSWSDIVAFGGDGGRESFCLLRSDLSIWMVDPTNPPEDRIPCGPSFALLIERLVEGWSPFDQH